MICSIRCVSVFCNLSSRNTSCRWVFASLLAFVTSIAFSNEEGLPGIPGINTHGFKHIDASDAGLFSVPFPGETYSPLTGRIGHASRDMVVTGNGPLPIIVGRKDEDIPKSYPFAFGNMSLQTPYLHIDTGAFRSADQDLTATPLRCSEWDYNAYDDIRFYYPGGMISFGRKIYLTQDTRNRYPPEALFISKSNWYVTCNGVNHDGPDFVVNAPDGTSYLMDQQEWIASQREIPLSSGGTHYDAYHQFRIYVHKIRKYGSVLTYNYEQASEWTADQFRVYPPLAVGKVAGNRHVIRNKLRLSSIVASNTLGNDNRVVNLYYYSNADRVCPNLISHIESSFATNTRLDYTYEKNTTTESVDNYEPVNQCRLKTVTLADGSFWQFEYGSADGDFAADYTPAGDVDDTTDVTDLDSKRYQQIYHPIKSVVAPTGAVVTYDYEMLGVCEFQDVYKQRLDGDYVDVNSCDNKKYRRPAVSQRDIYLTDPEIEGVSPEISHTIAYERMTQDDGPNTVRRTISNARRKHQLVYGRIERAEPPTASTISSGRRLLSGRILNHRIIDRSTDVVLAETDYQYGENQAISFIDFDSLDYPDEQDIDYVIESGRWKWTYDATRINRVAETRVLNGQNFETRRPISKYDLYNYPTVIHEKFGPNLEEGKTTVLGYDHNYTNKDQWTIGLLESRQSGVLSIPPTPVLGEQQLSVYDYNAKGQLETSTEQGFTQTFTYQGPGDLLTFNDGLNTTTFIDYRNGIPLKTYRIDNHFEQTLSAPNGLVIEIIDEEGHQQNIRYDTLGRVLRTWTGAGETGKTITIHPVWHDEGSLHHRRKSVKQPDRNIRYTFYDALGRVHLTQSVDQTDANKSVWRHYAYDNIGRVFFVSDPSRVNHESLGSEWRGTLLTYDALDRVLTRRHSHESGSIDYCYGAMCNGNGATNGVGGLTVGTVGHGYAMSDQEGYVSIYNYRSFGQPGNEELIEIGQQIDESESVFTGIERNVHGFITEVTQDGKTRSYTPYVNGSDGELTNLIGSETHPEFGTRDVTNYDAAGNMRNVSDFNGTNFFYTYTYLNQIDRIFTDSESFEINHDYYFNGNIQSITSNGELGSSAWNYIYQPDKNLLESETLSLDDYTFPLSYTYGEFDQMTGMSYPGGFSLNYDLNGFDQVTGIKFNDAQTSGSQLVESVKYHPNGALEEGILGNGLTFNISQNPLSLPEDWRVSRQDAVNDVLFMTYVYDDRQNVKRIANYFYPFNGGIQNMTYDGLNRLTGATSGKWGDASYDYNKRGDIKSATLSNRTLYYNYDADMRLTSVGRLVDDAIFPVYTYEYDEGAAEGNGNITSNGLGSFTYDELNRMTSSYRETMLDEVEYHHRYDGKNHRVRSRYEGDNPQRLTYYVYDGTGNLMHEFESETGEAKNHIFLSGQSIATIGSDATSDSDEDGIPDYYERLHGLNLYDDSDKFEDADEDGLNNYQEFELGSLAMNTDSDNDGMPDYWEWQNQLDLTVANGLADDDLDGVSNLDEYQNGTAAGPLRDGYLVPVIYLHSF